MNTMRILLPVLLALAAEAGAQSGGSGSGSGPVGPVVVVPQKPPENKPPENKPPEQGTPPVAKPATPPSKPGEAKGQPTDPKPAADKPAGDKPAGEKPTKPPVVEDDTPPPAPTQLPKSADPADIAAMQSAQAMLQAEARLRKMLKEGGIAGIDKILTFEELSNWPYEDGLKGMPAPVKKMDGKTVLMTGFMLPIDEVENIKEFLLVQSLWSCCYGQPPDINGIIRVVMKGDKRINYKYDPIKITGQFKVVASYEDGYCIDIYQLLADDVEVIK